MISLADFFFKGIQNTKLVSIQTAVRAYQFPFDDGGWNSPTRSIEMNSMGLYPRFERLFYELSLFNLMFRTLVNNLCNILEYPCTYPSSSKILLIAAYVLWKPLCPLWLCPRNKAVLTNLAGRTAASNLWLFSTTIQYKMLFSIL